MLFRIGRCLIADILGAIPPNIANILLPFEFFLRGMRTGLQEATFLGYFDEVPYKIGGDMDCGCDAHVSSFLLAGMLAPTTAAMGATNWIACPTGSRIPFIRTTSRYPNNSIMNQADEKPIAIVIENPKMANMNESQRRWLIMIAEAIKLK
jgi:hypothetical protein